MKQNNFTNVYRKKCYKPNLAEDGFSLLIQGHYILLNTHLRIVMVWNILNHPRMIPPKNVESENVERKNIEAKNVECKNVEG